MPLFAFVLGRVCNPNPPKDGTGGPWCRTCRYPLAGLLASAACPECGDAERMTRATGTDRLGRWAAWVFITTLAAHLPVWFVMAWLRLGWGAVPFAAAVALASALMFTLAIAILGGRLRGTMLLSGVLALVGVQGVINIVTAILLVANPPREKFEVVPALVATFGVLVASAVFDVFALVVGVWTYTGSRGERARPRPPAA